MAKTSPLEDQAIADVAALTTRCSELDMSFASLDRIEDFLRAHPDEEAKVASYVGQTLIHHAGGRWELPKPNTEDSTHPLITKFAVVPKARFYPSEVAYQGLRFAYAVIRDAVERYDIAHRRAVLAEQLAKLPAELEALRADIARLAHTSLTTLDDSPAVLTALEDALVALRQPGTSREELRQVRARAVLFLGDLVTRRTGGAWTVCEAPRGDFGEFEAHGWSPARAVTNVAADSRGIFERTLPLVYKRPAP